MGNREDRIKLKPPSDIYRRIEPEEEQADSTAVAQSSATKNATFWKVEDAYMADITRYYRRGVVSHPLRHLQCLTKSKNVRFC